MLIIPLAFQKVSLGLSRSPFLPFLAGHFPFAGAFPKTSRIQKHKHPQKLLGPWSASQLAAWRRYVYGKNIPTQNVKTTPGT